MNNLIARIKPVLKRIRALFPSRLPVGLAEFHAWSEEVIGLADVPFNDSTVFSLATMILHLPQTASWKSKEYFVRTLNKAAANEVAAAVMQDLKAKQAEKIKEAQAAAVKAADESAKAVQ